MNVSELPVLRYIIKSPCYGLEKLIVTETGWCCASRSSAGQLLVLAGALPCLQQNPAEMFISAFKHTTHCKIKKNQQNKQQNYQKTTSLDAFFLEFKEISIIPQQRYFCPRLFSNWRHVGSFTLHLNHNNCHIFKKLS